MTEAEAKAIAGGICDEMDEMHGLWLPKPILMSPRRSLNVERDDWVEKIAAALQHREPAA